MIDAQCLSRGLESSASSTFGMTSIKCSCMQEVESDVGQMSEPRILSLQGNRLPWLEVRSIRQYKCSPFCELYQAINLHQNRVPRVDHLIGTQARGSHAV
jgi:hypothetical protein